MTGCTATLTTAEVEPCPHDLTPGYAIPNEHFDACLKDHAGQVGGNGWMRTTVWVSTCDLTSSGHPEHTAPGDVCWTDDTPGARPQVDPLVTDAELDAAAEACGVYGSGNWHAVLRTALEAAAEARKADA